MKKKVETLWERFDRLMDFEYSAEQEAHIKEMDLICYGINRDTYPDDEPLS